MNWLKEQELGKKHLRQEIWDNTVIHGKNYMEVKTPHDKEVARRRDPVIPVAGETPEWSLRRRRWWFGEKGLGMEEETESFSAPQPSSFIDEPLGEEILALGRNFQVKFLKFLRGGSLTFLPPITPLSEECRWGKLLRK
jgi:hypothetical protein